MRNAISASRAFSEICPPQLGPTKVVLTSLTEDRCRSLASASWTLVCPLNGSFSVCTCQLVLLPTPTFCTIASLPPPAASTTWSIWADVAAGALNWKMEPPLNSTL